MTQKQILVTGAAGFIGARFVESCVERGYSVISVDDRAYFQERTEHKDVDFGTVVDRKNLFSWLKKEKIKLAAMVHLGACTDTTEFDVAYLNKINVEYSKNIWNWASQNNVPLVYASSAATYGEGELGYDDSEELIPKLKPLNPYGQSKQDIDLWVLEQERRGCKPPSWSAFKFFNVYGFGERHKKDMSSVVLKAFDQIRQKNVSRLFKSYRNGIAHGEQKRDFVFVGDVVNVLHFALEKPIKRGIYNLGTGEARSFLDLVRAVFEELGKKDNIEWIEMPEAIKDKYQYFTEAHMERLCEIGYKKPFTSLEDGIHQYIQKLCHCEERSNVAISTH